MKNEPLLEFGSLFSGAGGLDLGIEQAGLKCTFQVENDKHCLTILNRHFPDLPKNEIRPCMGLVGGDPCPIRSCARGSQPSRTPDMSGYFLAMVARCRPRWILHENVPAPDVVDFRSGLELLGYSAGVVQMDAAAFTGMSRRREFVAGFDQQETHNRFRCYCDVAEGHTWNDEAFRKSETCINGLSTGRGFRLSENLVYENRRGLRLLTCTERESLQGFPTGWTDGIPYSARLRALGNAVTVPVAKWLGERIKEALINPR